MTLEVDLPIYTLISFLRQTLRALFRLQKSLFGLLSRFIDYFAMNFIEPSFYFSFDRRLSHIQHPLIYFCYCSYHSTSTRLSILIQPFAKQISFHHNLRKMIHSPYLNLPHSDYLCHLLLSLTLKVSFIGFDWQKTMVLEKAILDFYNYPWAVVIEVLHQPFSDTYYWHFE